MVSGSHQAAADPEEIVNGTMGGEKALSGAVGETSLS